MVLLCPKGDIILVIPSELGEAAISVGEQASVQQSLQKSL